MPRQRNSSGQRIRVDGARMNAEECCCDVTFATCAEFLTWLQGYVDGGGEFTLTTPLAAGTCGGASHPECEGTPNCAVFVGPYIVSVADQTSSFPSKVFRQTLSGYEHCIDSFTDDPCDAGHLMQLTISCSPPGPTASLLIQAAVVHAAIVCCRFGVEWRRTIPYTSFPATLSEVLGSMSLYSDTLEACQYGGDATIGSI